MAEAPKHSSTTGQPSPPPRAFYFTVYRLLFRLERFAVAGTMAACVHWASMAGLAVLGMHPWLASTVGAVAAAIAGYQLQCRFGFRRAGSRRRLCRYMLVMAFATAANVGVLALLMRSGIAVAPAQFISSMMVGVLNFFVLRSCVFGAAASRLR